jgi:hypothetical protein
MKKLLTTFLILFTLLTFSNSAFAFSFGDFFKDVADMAKKALGVNEEELEKAYEKCKIEYTQLNLNTGIENNIKYTAQFKFKYAPIGYDGCYLATQDFAEKINEWLSENNKNVIANITVVSCKTMSVWKKDWPPINFASNRYEYRWTDYKSCENETNVKLIDWIEYPKQQGFNVHKERLTELMADE